MILLPALKRIDTNKGIVSFAIPANLQDTVNGFFQHNDSKRNYYYAVKISLPRRPRSTGKNSQSHHLNGHCQQISSGTGQPFEDVKKRCKQLAIDMGYPILQDETGKPLQDLWGQSQGISEADSSVEECKLLIEAAHMLAAFCDIRLIEGDHE